MIEEIRKIHDEIKNQIEKLSEKNLIPKYIVLDVTAYLLLSCDDDSRIEKFLHHLYGCEIVVFPDDNYRFIVKVLPDARVTALYERELL